MKPAMIISTYPDKKSASQAASKLVADRTAACVNITKISSVYSWKGRIENTTEYLALFKTTARNKRLLKKAILETHPYDVPEIVEVDVASVNEPYMQWLAESTSNISARRQPRRVR
ncbi:MAG: divalent-cation tolerance protein CutA [Nitrosopumilus sp. B06]|nr:MAG: divalent-cation tolerance protein CutA [Nitrosopumilus sp. B06]